MIGTVIADSFRTRAPLALFGLLALLPVTGYAQTTEQQLAENLQQARDALLQLDELAGVCLDTPAGLEACSEFRGAVDGALLASYLESCAVVKTWRDEFVTGQAQGVEPPPSSSESLLNFLVDIEYLCGENALARATENVLPAYRLTRSARVADSSLARSLQYQLDSDRQNTLIEQQRHNLSRGIASPDTRARREIQRQFDQLEIELIRQQLNRSLPR